MAQVLHNHAFTNLELVKGKHVDPARGMLARLRGLCAAANTDLALRVVANGTMGGGDDLFALDVTVL